MALILPKIWTRARYMAVAVILAALLLPMALTTPVSADERDDTNHAIMRAFDVLRTAIDDTEGLPHGPKTSLLAKADAAEIALLLPAVQSAREAARREQARNGVVVIRILIALQQENRILSDIFGYDGDAIDLQAAAIQRYVIENAWPT